METDEAALAELHCLLLRDSGSALLARFHSMPSHQTITSIDWQDGMLTRLQQSTIDWVNDHEEQLVGTADALWMDPEVGLLEKRSSKLLADTLEHNGFSVSRGVAGMPTAFLAEWGRGGPVIGLFAEYDALPGVGNDRVPFRKRIDRVSDGHGCGHNLTGSCHTWSGIALKETLEDREAEATIRVFGTPAEELLVAKVFMAREGLFDDLSVILYWHPAWQNTSDVGSCLATFFVRFKFRGAARAPRPLLGRASDAAARLEHFVHSARKRLPELAAIDQPPGHVRRAPSPERAEARYFVTAKSFDEAESVYRSVVEAARGIAAATGTELDIDLVTACRGYLPNMTLGRALLQNFLAIGSPNFNENEIDFATRLQRAAEGDASQAPLDLEPPRRNEAIGLYSNDGGDVSWYVPLGKIATAAWVQGTPKHNWATTASCGMSIGHKAMLTGTKVLASTAIEVVEQPMLIKEAKAELDERLGGRPYAPYISEATHPPDPAYWNG